MKLELNLIEFDSNPRLHNTEHVVTWILWWDVTLLRYHSLEGVFVCYYRKRKQCAFGH
jgi:hypothetical protein